MSILTLFLTIPYFLVVTECCMRMVPPDDVYIPSTLAPEESTMAPGESTVAPMAPSTTIAAEETRLPEEMMTTPAMESSTVTEKVCAVTEEKCLNLATVVQGTMQMFEKDGCIEFMYDAPYFKGEFADSEIPPPTADDEGNELTIIRPKSPAEIAIGLVAYYGLACVDNKLTATEYPRGINSVRTGDVYGTDGSYSGKKSILSQVDCD